MLSRILRGDEDLLLVCICLIFIPEGFAIVSSVECQRRWNFAGGRSDEHIVAQQAVPSLEPPFPALLNIARLIPTIGNCGFSNPLPIPIQLINYIISFNIIYKADRTFLESISLMTSLTEVNLGSSFFSLLWVEFTHWSKSANRDWYCLRLSSCFLLVSASPSLFSCSTNTIF